MGQRGRSRGKRVAASGEPGSSAGKAPASRRARLDGLSVRREGRADEGQKALRNGPRPRTLKAVHVEEVEPPNGPEALLDRVMGILAQVIAEIVLRPSASRGKTRGQLGAR